MILSEKIDPGLIWTAMVPALIADGVLNPSGLPTVKPLTLPAPEKMDRLTRSTVTGPLVACGPAVSRPFLTMESRNKAIPIAATISTTIRPKPTRNKSFFIG